MKDKMNKSDYAQEMKEKRNALYAKSDEQMESLLEDPYKFINFLKLMSNVNYSVLNSLLVYASNPHATLVRSTDAWKERKIQVNEGEEGIEILAPGKEYTRKDGSVSRYFESKLVFDISQTDRGSLKEYETKYDSIREALSNHYHLLIVESFISEAEYDAGSNEMLVSKDLDKDASLNALFKEFTRLELSKENINKIEENYYCDCVGYMLSNRYHTNGYNTHLIGSAMDSIFKGKEMTDIRKEMNQIYQTYRKMKNIINSEISREYQEKNE